MSFWIIIPLSLVVCIATFLLGEWLANDGSFAALRDRNDRPRDGEGDAR